MPEQDLAAKLTPTHLTDLPSADKDLRKQIENEVTPDAKDPKDRAGDPRNEEQYTFRLKYKDARGKAWPGTFVSKILSLTERQYVAVLRARFQAGTSLEALDADTADLNFKLAHMTYSLTERPQWAEDLRKLLDPGIIDAIYEEIASHEAFFLGWSAPNRASSTQSGDRDSDG